MADTAEPIVYRPGGRGRGVATTAGPVLVVVGLALAVIGAVGSGVAGLLGGLVLVAIGLAAMSTLRQRAVLTDQDLTVRGRLSQRRVRLRDLRAAHEDRTHTPWVQAEGQAPFRVYFAQPADSATDRDQALVPALRRRASAAGASLDADADLVAAPPHGTSVLFSL